MEEYNTEPAQNIHSCASDILRWVMLILIKGRASADRKRDIIYAAQRIISLVEKL